MLLELFAYVGDTLMYYQDRVANEAFLATAVERRSVIDLLSLIGYTLGTPAPAALKLTLRASNTAATPVVIEVGARFSTVAAPGKPAIDFVYLPGTDPTATAPLAVARDGTGGELAIEIPVVQATRVLREALGITTGDRNEAFPLKQRPVVLPRDADAQDWIRVEIDAGGGFETWHKRKTLLYSTANDPHYTVSIDDQDRAQIVLGDGTYGRLVPAGSQLRASYMVGGGAAGNVGPNTITVLTSGVNVSAKLSHALAASGGQDRETIEHARELAPQVFRSFQRAVTADDYAALARNVPGVARAIAVPQSWSWVDLYVVPDGGYDLSDALRATLLRYFETRRLVTVVVTPRSPVFVRVDLTINVEVEPTFYRDDVAQRARDALDALFAVDNLDFGRNVYVSKVFEAVEAIDGVAFAEVTGFQGTRSSPPGSLVVPSPASPGVLQLGPREFPRSGTITVVATKGLV
jgi:predicted phage baseplate assembly protein